MTYNRNLECAKLLYPDAHGYESEHGTCLVITHSLVSNIAVNIETNLQQRDAVVDLLGHKKFSHWLFFEGKDKPLHENCIEFIDSALGGAE